MQTILDALQANAVIIGLVVGSLTPLVISLVQQPTLSTRTRKIVATSVSVVVGVLLAASTGDLTGIDNLADFTNLVGIVGAVWAAAETFFQKVWKPAGVTDTLEQVTSPWVPREPEVEWVTSDDEPYIPLDPEKAASSRSVAERTKLEFK